MHVSKVRSLTLDKWEEQTVKVEYLFKIFFVLNATDTHHLQEKWNFLCFHFLKRVVILAIYML